MAIREVYLPTTGVTLVNLGSPPEVEAEIKRRTEYSKRCPQVPDDDPATLARMKRLLAKPDLNYLCKSVGDGE